MGSSPRADDDIAMAGFEIAMGGSEIGPDGGAREACTRMHWSSRVL
ncbi:hypothetical protein [Spirillospora sp. NPDC047279]